MRPCLHDDWFLEYEADAVFIIQRNRLFHPALRPFQEKAANAGVARAREIAKYLCQFDGYFASKLQFRKWLNNVSYREALRVLLHLEPVEAALEELPRDSRSLIRWSYIDQLTLDEVARLLDLQTHNRFYFDKASARERIVDAYKQLCRVILRRFQCADSDVADRFKDLSRVFPAPPTLSGNFDIPFTLGRDQKP